MFDSIFELLFKYRPVVFEQGDLTFLSPGSVGAGLLAAVVVAVPAALTYLRVRGKTGPMDRVVLTALRLFGLAVIAFCLLRPALVISTVVPQQNFVGVLIDDSRSMQIRDVDERPRSDFVHESFGNEESRLLSALAERFTLRFFRFSSAAERLSDVGELGFTGTRTELGPALERARSELASVPLSGLVLVSDGADNSGEELAETLLPLQAQGTPVFTVGLGRERFDRDIQISRVQTPRSVLVGSSLVVDVVVAQTGYRGRKAALLVEDEGVIVSSQEITLPPDGEPATVPVRFTAATPGPRTFRFRIAPENGERVTQNNARESLIVVEDRREKILYFEGEPRYEVKFLRRAVADDKNLQVVVLQRTAENKFLRLDVDDREELVGGFPRTREELFAYRGLILGSVEASFFTRDQLQMIADFVDQRGGGLLVLGGRRALAEGGYAGTPVADALPVILDADEAAAPGFHASMSVRPTLAGRTHPALQIAGTEEASAERWSTLPELLTYNPLHRVKPGATALLEGQGDRLPQDQVVLAFQRYGRGKALAFTVQDSWTWQFHADMPLEDMTHETLWRQLLRWLVDGVPEQVMASVPEDHVEPGEAVTLMANVDDSTYLEVNNSSVEAVVHAPSGAETTVPLQWTVDRDGEYRARFVPTEEGLHSVQVQASSGGQVFGTDMAYFVAGPRNSEYFDAGMRAPLLRRIADETGGRFYTPANVATLPEDLRITGAGITLIEEYDLWDMPVLLVLLLLVILGEWTYRRIRGLA